MPSDFKVFTDAGVQVIFDPAAVKTLLEQQDSRWFDALPEEVKAGRLATRVFGDGEAFFRVFLEQEPIPRSMVKRAGAAVKGLLQVPSGRLHFAALESLVKSPGPPLELSPGRYELTLREMEWGELVEEMAERAARKVSPSGATASEVLGAMGGCLVVLIGIGGLASLVAVLNSGWSAWSMAWPWLLGTAGVLGLVAMIWRAWPGAKASMEARRAVQDRFPTTMVVLRKLSEGEGPSSGCVLEG